jgi:hypothetical protein
VILDVRTKPIAKSFVELETFGGNPKSFWANYQPGNGTAYRFLMQRLERGTQAAEWFLGQDACGWVVAFASPDRYRTFAFSEDSYLSPLWVAEKTGAYQADAVVLAEVLAHLAGPSVTAPSSDEFLKEDN